MPSFAAIALPSRRGHQRRIDPRGFGMACWTQPLGQVEPAVIGGQHHRIVDPARVEEGEQPPIVASSACIWMHISAPSLPVAWPM